MKAQYFIYTRNRKVDYKAILSPSEEFCPKETRKKFLQDIRGLIDIETYDDPLDTPRWLYSCFNGFVLFGLGVMNSNLSDEYNTDFTGRPVRGFFGIVIQYSPVSIILPMDLNFFKLVYEKHIEPIWNCDKDHFPNPVVNLDIDIQDGISVMHSANTNVTLNYQKNRCVILGDVNIKDVFSIALASSRDITIVTGFNNKRHAFTLDSEYQFMNAIVNGVCEREERLYDEEDDRNITTNHEPISQDAQLPSKKDYRLKLFIGIILLLIFSLLIMNKSCQKNQKNPKLSVSGDTIQTIKHCQKKQ